MGADEGKTHQVLVDHTGATRPHETPIHCIFFDLSIHLIVQIVLHLFLWNVLQLEDRLEHLGALLVAVYDIHPQALGLDV